MPTQSQPIEVAQPVNIGHNNAGHKNDGHNNAWIENAPLEKARLENALLWFLKVASGVFIIILLGIHLIANHLVAEGGLMNYADVVRYLSQPWIAALELTFLVCVVSHALLGLRSVLLDLNPAPRLQRILDGTLLALGSGSVIYGIWLTATIISRGKGI